MEEEVVVEPLEQVVVVEEPLEQVVEEVVVEEPLEQLVVEEPLEQEVVGEEVEEEEVLVLAVQEYDPIHRLVTDIRVCLWCLSSHCFVSLVQTL